MISTQNIKKSLSCIYSLTNWNSKTYSCSSNSIFSCRYDSLKLCGTFKDVSEIISSSSKRGSSSEEKESKDTINDYVLRGTNSKIEWNREEEERRESYGNEDYSSVVRHKGKVDEPAHEVQDAVN